MTQVADLRLHEDYTLWNIDFAFSSSFELPVAQVENVLPSNLIPKEVRPGVGLLSLTLFRFHESNDFFPQALHELVVAVHIEPDLALVDMPPQAALFVLNIVSDDTKFVTDSYGIDCFPTVLGDFSFDVDREAKSVVCYDGDNVVFSLNILSDPQTFTPSQEYYQSFCLADGALHMASALFELSKAEWQNKSQSAGTLYAHPIFSTLDISTIDTHNCYVQKISAPHEKGLEIYFTGHPVTD